MSARSQENVVGAIIFFSYIVAALLLTGILCNDVQKAFSNRQRKNQQSLQDQKARISLSAALATLSFAVLSYHMLSFLIQSYQAWSTGSVSSSTSPVTFHAFRYAVKNLVPSEIWAWAVNSTLFRDFADVICNDPDHFWWTQAALLYSYAWNVYMSVEGTFSGSARQAEV
ncbi:hypothetical protein EDD36DRAFT_323018 [Exophiala viscosa]|uniref:Uncharacterized protein n=1 Tax=Exophiala viscosa TaxID=2486360 RepID=A0AAN6DQS4_9EURO|nr:hypothetical protein EDD36DRAFT_323018 [Exophiala viscosa]